MKVQPIRIALIGLGKIARDQHLPALAANAAFEIAATVSPDGPGVDGIRHYSHFADLLADGQTIDAVALCTPPQVRTQIALQAIERGLHVLLEKPPGATLGEVGIMDRAAEQANTTLFAAWHSRFAAGVDPARKWLASRTVLNVAIVWREDVRRWHPGQAWIWQPGGLGVFDPGINALSIASHILPGAIMLEEATLTFPENRAAPIAANLALSDLTGAQIGINLDWRQEGAQSWDIIVETDAGTLTLANGGASISLPGQKTQHFQDREYPALYDHFAALISSGKSDVDITPLRLVADAFLLGRRDTADAFFD